MITESIKTLLGEDLAAQVDTALKGKGKDGKPQKGIDNYLLLFVFGCDHKIVDFTERKNSPGLPLHPIFNIASQLKFR